MNAGTRFKRWKLLFLIMISVITIVVIGLVRGWGSTKHWIFDMAIGCLELVVLWSISQVIRKGHGHPPFPFRIASGLVILFYAVFCILEITLFGSVLKLSPSSYMAVHVVAFVGCAVVFVVIERFGQYAAALHRKDSELLSSKRRMSDRAISVREQIQRMPELPQQKELLAEIHELEETLQFSDPVLNAPSDEINQLIEQKFSLLEDQMKLIIEVPATERPRLIQEAFLLVRDIDRTVSERR
ncbi:hypothetical protein ACK8P5_04645 [Paenibacillus sp. EC2-1]|uniref:hypothetical protein n=1 Tax=Paenibacillus sp. EC2-1 TaxID=3388665 RepID=UPI003BEEE61C